MLIGLRLVGIDGTSSRHAMYSAVLRLIGFRLVGIDRKILETAKLGRARFTKAVVSLALTSQCSDTYVGSDAKLGIYGNFCVIL